MVFDNELEDAIEEDSELEISYMNEKSIDWGGGWIIVVEYEGEEYSINEDRRVQYNLAKTIRDTKDTRLSPPLVIAAIKNYN
jgi:hypothetical protein